MTGALRKENSRFLKEDVQTNGFEGESGLLY